MVRRPSLFHVMAKPPLDLRAAIYRFPWATRARAASLLHWTVFPLGELFEIGCGVPTLREALAEVEAEPFTLVFDKIRGHGRHAKLEIKNVPAAVRQLRLAVFEALIRAGVRVSLHGSRPHVTLDYKYAGEGFEQKIDPIIWEVDRFILVESLIGEGAHEHHCERRLIPRQGTLFPLRRPLR
jgi:2'-5' RNA ligase